MPAPLTPLDCDLRDFPFMPLEIRRLLTSETWVLGTAAEKVAALTLWCESWHQVPAASVPSDERMLAHLSGAGSAWRKVREMALRGWIKCADGRLYHPVVAEKALESWKKKEAQRERTRKATQSRWGSRSGESAVSGGMAARGEAPEGIGAAVEDDVRHGAKTKASAPNGAMPDVSVTDNATDTVTSTKGQGEGEGESSPSSLRSDGCPSLPLEAPEQSGVDLAVRAWNDTARRLGWPQVAKITPARRQSIAARLNEHSIAVWREMLDRLSKTDWIVNPEKRANGHAQWQPTIDWFAKQSTFLKIIEGAYGGAAKPVDWEKAVKIWREHGYWNPDNGPAPDKPGYRGPPAEDDAWGGRPV